MNSNTTNKAPMFQIRDAIYAADLKPHLKFVLIALSDGINSDRGDWQVWPSQKTLIQRTGYGERTIRTNTHELARLGFISIEAKKCDKGERYVYTVNHNKLGLPAKFAKTAGGGAAIFAESDAKTADKEQNTKSKVRRKIEHPSDEQAVACAGIQDSSQEESGEDVTPDQLLQDYYPQWTTSRSARLAVYCRLGRKHFPGNPYFAPDKKYKATHLDTLDGLFDQWDKCSADVLDFVMRNWSKYKPGDSRVTPTLVALDMIEGWSDILKDWRKDWQARQNAEAIRRVEKNVVPVADDGYYDSARKHLAADCSEAAA